MRKAFPGRGNLCQVGIGGRKEGGSNVCLQTGRLLTKHMACLLQRSRSAAKPPGSRRGYIPRDPEGACVQVAAAGEGSANCWAPEHLEGAAHSEGKQKTRGKVGFQNFYLSASS